MLVPPPAPEVPALGRVVVVVQPPNSSSAATLGAVLKPPEAPGTMLCEASAFPAVPQPNELVVAGAMGLARPGLFSGAAVVVVAGSGVSHGLDPHTSAFDRLVEPKEPSVLAVAAAGWALGWLGAADRLKTELVDAGAAGVLENADGAGACEVVTGAERSNRSPRADEDAGGGSGFCVDAGAPNMAEPVEALTDLCCW